jgi:CDP-glycerol glycerophosphotransferase (TagB/SpsB family)
LDIYNITLYFAFHRQIWYNLKSRSKLKINNHIKYIEEKDISFILCNTSLIVSDFSSIIFDIIYREKPFVIFIPDSNDPTLSEIYSDNYYQLIKDIKDGTISFQNTFFSIEDTVKKINFYIKNNFTLEPKLKMFYNKFGFKKENNTNNYQNEYYLK